MGDCKHKQGMDLKGFCLTCGEYCEDIIAKQAKRIAELEAAASDVITSSARWMNLPSPPKEKE